MSSSLSEDFLSLQLARTNITTSDLSLPVGGWEEGSSRPVLVLSVLAGGGEASHRLGGGALLPRPG